MRVQLRLVHVLFVATIATVWPLRAQEQGTSGADELPPAKQDEPADETAPRTTSGASCWLKIAPGETKFPPDLILKWIPRRLSLEQVNELAETEGIDESDLTDLRQRLFIYQYGEPLSLGDDSIMVPIEALSKDERVQAGKLLEPVAKSLERRLTHLDAPKRQRLEPHIAHVEADIQSNKRRYADNQEKASELMRQIERPVISRERWEENFQRLKNQQQEIQLALLGLQARERAIERRIAELAERVEEQTENDEVGWRLSEVVQILKRRIAQMQKANEAQPGSLVEQEINRVRQELAAAEADLARSRRSAVREAGGDQLSALHMRLTETAIEREELEARLNYLDERAIPEAEQNLQEAQKIENRIREQEQEVERIIMERDMALEQLRDATARYQELKRELASHREPTVTIISNE